MTYEANQPVRVYIKNGFKAARYVRSYERKGNVTHVVTVAGKEVRVGSVNITRALEAA